MKLVIGGAFQGKKDYACETWQIRDGWIDGRTCQQEELYSCRAVDAFQDLIRRLLSGMDEKSVLQMEQWSKGFAAELVKKNPDLVVVCRELGSGIVPMDKTDRTWREAVGRICTALAKEAEEVVRVSCGIGMRIK